MIIVFLLTALGVGYYGQHVQTEAKSLYIKSMNVTFGKPSSDYDFKSAEELGVDISDSCFTPITFTTYDYPEFSVIIYTNIIFGIF